jgi:hypothetical protein
VELSGAVADMVAGIHRAVLTFSSGGARSAVAMGAVAGRVHQIRSELEGVAVAIFTVLSVPVYVLGHRWGTSIIGWDPDAVAR